MMDNVAVVLRGHVRTWFYNYPLVFDFYNSIAKNVDYYVVTWKGSFDGRELEDSFESKNLKLFVRLETEDWLNSWFGPAWQSYYAAPHILYNHRQTVYDAVFDTRPDIVYQQIPNKSIIVPEPNTVYTPQFTMHDRNYNINNPNYYIGLTDLFLMSTPEAYMKMSQRFVKKKTVECHSDLKIWCDEVGVNTCILDWVEQGISRPNSIAAIPNCHDFFNNNKTKTSWTELFNQWAEMSSNSKQDLLKKYNISKIDYVSQNPFASI